MTNPSPECDLRTTNSSLTEEVVSTQAEEQVWRPIESAPRDGTAIWILVDGKAYIGLCEPANWLHSEDRWSAKFYVERASAERKARECYDQTWGTNFKAEPTHWMPLPPPPDGSLVLKTERTETPCE